MTFNQQQVEKVISQYRAGPQVDGFPLAVLGRLSAFRVVTDFPVTTKEKSQAESADPCSSAEFSDEDVGRPRSADPIRSPSRLLIALWKQYPGKSCQRLSTIVAGIATASETSGTVCLPDSSDIETAQRRPIPVGIVVRNVVDTAIVIFNTRKAMTSCHGHTCNSQYQCIKSLHFRFLPWKLCDPTEPKSRQQKLPEASGEGECSLR